MQKKILTLIIILTLSVNLISISGEPNKEHLEITQRVELLRNEPNLQETERLLSNTPRAFTENRGQLENNEVRFYDQGGSVWFTDDGVWFELREYAETRGQGLQLSGQGGVSGLGFDLTERFREMEPVEYKRVILKQEFVGANQVRPVGRERLSWNSNFFYGNDSLKWCTEVPNYNEIYYENLYDGIDLRYYTNEKGLKYDFIVHPGACPGQIAVKYEGSEGITIVDGSNLIIETRFGNLLDTELCIYQKYNGKKHQINGNFLIYNDMEYGFEIQEEYNDHENLIIDPVLMYSTYVGDTGEESARDIEVDSNGYAYITGGTTSSNFPVTAGAYNPSYTGSGDVFVMKLNANGSAPVYSTFVGGASGERGWAIGIDSTGNAYVAGRSWGSGFPVTSGVYDDTFNGGLYDLHVFKLNSMGSDLLFSTYLGGSQNDGPREIEVDITGNVSVIGSTNSSDFPTTLGAYNRTLQSRSDVFVSKLTNDGSKLIGSTFIGGNHDDIGEGIKTDSEGNLYCISRTRSTDFPSTPNAYSTKNNGIYDAAIFKFNENASKLIYSTYIGGSSTDSGCDIELDNTGCVYGIGYTYSTDFPTTNGAYDTSNNGEFDCFIVKLNQTGSKLLYSTYLGGSGSDTALKLALDSDRNVYIAGSPGSNDFPITPGCLNYSFSKNIFITVFNLTCSNVLYSTFFGGESYDILGGIALDPNNNIYVAGQTESTKFPVTPGVLGPSYGGNRDGFASKIQCKPEINITSLELLKDGKPVETIYSCLSPYTFRVDFTRILLQTDIQVHLNLDPLNTNLQLLWNSDTGKFKKIFDPDNVITLEPSSYAYNSTWFEWTLDFNITFNWTYPDEDFNDVQIIASSLAKNYAWLNKTNFYRIENDLDFLGILSVRDESNRQIENNDVIRGGMELTWMGLKVTYENTTDIYPPIEEFDVTIWDEANNSWSDSPATGGYIMIQTIIDSKTNLLGETYIINITGIPPKCDKTDESFIIRIDGDNVTFSNPTPDNTTWQTFSNVGVGIHIQDINGAGIYSASIMNCFSTDNGTTWSEWEGISGLEPDPTMFLDVENMVTLDDGTDNFVKWRARDLVGNGPTESDAYRIIVDTQNIIFSNAKPLETEESAFENVEVGINISDLTSGVESTTVEYIISTNMGLTWGPWTSVANLENGNNIDIKLNLTFPNGSANRIKWRASDIAGNGPTESTEYIVKVNTWKQSLPKVNLISPENGTTLYVLYVKLEWSLVNTKMSGVTYDIILDTKYPPSEVKQENHIYTNFVPQNIQDETTYYWTIIPKRGSESGFCNSGIWSFTINTSVPIPRVQLISPKNGVKEKNAIIKFEWELLYDGTDDATYQIFIWDPEGTVNITENITFKNYFLDVYVFNIEYKMYFWKVIPRTQTIVGLESDTWTFYFEPPGPTPHFEIKLSLTPSVAQLKPGQNTSAVLSVTNLGEQTDRISIRIQPLNSSIITIDIIEPTTKSIGIGEQENFLIRIEIPIETPKGDAYFYIIAKSETAQQIYGLKVEENTTLTVKVLETGPGEIKPDKKGFDFLLILSLIIVIIIIVLIAVFVLMKKKKKPDEENEPGLTQPPPQQSLPGPQGIQHPLIQAPPLHPTLTPTPPQQQIPPKTAEIAQASLAPTVSPEQQQVLTPSPTTTPVPTLPQQQVEPTFQLPPAQPTIQQTPEVEAQVSTIQPVTQPTIPAPAPSIAQQISPEAKPSTDEQQSPTTKQQNNVQ